MIVKNSLLMGLLLLLFILLCPQVSQASPYTAQDYKKDVVITSVGSELINILLLGSGLLGILGLGWRKKK